MQSKYTYLRILLYSIFFIAACKNTPKTKTDIGKYLYDESNGFSISKNTGVFHLNVTYLPSLWRALNEEPIATNLPDSIIQYFDKSLLFVFTISPMEGKSEGDVFLSGVNSKQDYEERVKKANFGFAYSWILHLDNGTEISPVGVQMEQTNGLTEHRKFHILFDVSQYPEVHQSSTWDLKLNDDVFNSGIHHFVISKEDRDRLD